MGEKYLRITERDIRICEDLLRHGVMGYKALAGHFMKAGEQPLEHRVKVRTSERLTELIRHGLVERVPYWDHVAKDQRWAYHLTATGLRTLHRHDAAVHKDRTKPPPQPQMEHIIWTQAVMADVAGAAGWITDKEFMAREAAVAGRRSWQPKIGPGAAPDALIPGENGNDDTWVEIDLGQYSAKQVRAKLQGFRSARAEALVWVAIGDNRAAQIARTAARCLPASELGRIHVTTLERAGDRGSWRSPTEYANR